MVGRAPGAVEELLQARGEGFPCLCRQSIERDIAAPVDDGVQHSRRGQGLQRAIAKPADAAAGFYDDPPGQALRTAGLHVEVLIDDPAPAPCGSRCATA